MLGACSAGRVYFTVSCAVELCVVQRMHCMQSCTVHPVWGGVDWRCMYTLIAQVYSKLAEGVERMSWLQRYLPSSMAQGISDRLAAASQWARRLSGEKGASQGSQVCGGHHYHHLSSLVPSLPAPSPSLPSPLHTPPDSPPDSTPLSPLPPLQDSERATYRRSEVSPGARERRLEKDNSALQVSGTSRTPHCLLSHHSSSHPATGGLTLHNAVQSGGAGATD